MSKSNFNQKSLQNLKQYGTPKTQQKELSVAVKNKVRSILLNWLPTEKKYIVESKRRNASNNAPPTIAPKRTATSSARLFAATRKLTMLTLTFDQSTANNNTDTELKRKYLNTFINYLTRNGVTHWFWIAETQQNGNLHFHMIVNFFDKQFLEQWKSITDNNSSSAIKDRPLNSSFIKIVGYLLKDDNNRIIDGRRYGMSGTVKEFENIKITDAITQADFMQNNVKDMKVTYEHEFFYVAKPTSKLRAKIQTMFMKIRRRQ